GAAPDRLFPGDDPQRRWAHRAPEAGLALRAALRRPGAPFHRPRVDRGPGPWVGHGTRAGDDGDPGRGPGARAPPASALRFPRREGVAQLAAGAGRGVRARSRDAGGGGVRARQAHPPLPAAGRVAHQLVNMRQVITLAMAALVLGAANAGAQDEAVTFDAARARIHKAARQSPLTGPDGATTASVVARSLRDHGASLATVASLREISVGRAAKTGLTHLRMEQRVAGLRVAGAYVKAALDEQGRLVHLIEDLADVPARRPVAAAVDERRALRSVLAVFLPEVKEEPAEIGRRENVVLFDKGTFFHEAPRVERVAILMKSGAL